MSESENKSSFEPDWPIWFIIVCIFGFFAWVAIPNRVGSHTSPANVRINNLRQIDGAAAQFALENHLTNGDRINFPNDLTPYIKLDAKGNPPKCPQGGTYTIGKVGEPPTCSLGTTVTPSHVLP